jgi:hypothetical protein
MELEQTLCDILEIRFFKGNSTERAQNLMCQQRSCMHHFVIQLILRYSIVLPTAMRERRRRSVKRTNCFQYLRIYGEIRCSVNDVTTGIQRARESLREGRGVWLAKVHHFPSICASTASKPWFFVLESTELVIFEQFVHHKVKNFGSTEICFFLAEN